MSDLARIISSARLIAACTLASRVTGMVRDMLLVQAFGLTWVADAFNYGFQFPNLFRRLFGEGALAAVFVPCFTASLQRGGRADAARLLGRTRAVLGLLLIGLVALLELVLLAIAVATPREDATVAYDTYLLLALTALMLPFMITICMLALFGSVLNCVGSFAPAAGAPILLNGVMIVALAWIAPALADAPEERAAIVAISVPVAGLLQLAWLAAALRAHQLRPTWTLNPGDPEVRGMAAMMGPVLLGQGAVLVSTFLDVQACALLTGVRSGDTGRLLGWEFAYPLEAGALTALSVAQRLYQFPLGVLVISLATAALPQFSRLAAQGEWTHWSAQVRGTLRLALFEGFAAGAMMIALAEPIVRLLFEYGRFGPADTERSAEILRWYGLGMWAFCAQHIVLRAFYSVSDVRTPVWISCGLLPVNFAMSLTLVWWDGVRESAFAVSSVITSAASVTIGLSRLARNREHRVWDAALIRAVGQMLLSAAAAAGAVWALSDPARHWTDELAAPIAIQRSIEVFGLLAVGGAVLAAASWMLGVPELRGALARLRRRGGGHGPPSDAPRAA